MIKINTSGDYVQLIYVDPVQESVQQELKSDTDAFECSYDSEGKLYLQFGLMRFENPDPTDFTINGVAVTDAADFISKLNALFTGGGGGGNGIYGGSGSLPSDVTVDLNAHEFSIRDVALQNSITINPTISVASISVGNGTIFASLNLNGQSTPAFNLETGNGANSVNINGDSDDNLLVYTAGTHNIVGAIKTGGQATFTGSLADAITGNLQVVNGLIVSGD